LWAHFGASLQVAWLFPWDLQTTQIQAAPFNELTLMQTCNKSHEGMNKIWSSLTVVCRFIASSIKLQTNFVGLQLCCRTESNCISKPSHHRSQQPDDPLLCSFQTDSCRHLVQLLEHAVEALAQSGAIHAVTMRPRAMSTMVGRSLLR
jgi:hypothetical protein